MEILRKSSYAGVFMEVEWVNSQMKEPLEPCAALEEFWEGGEWGGGDDSTSQEKADLSGQWRAETAKTWKTRAL